MVGAWDLNTGAKVDHSAVSSETCSHGAHHHCAICISDFRLLISARIETSTYPVLQENPGQQHLLCWVSQRFIFLQHQAKINLCCHRKGCSCHCFPCLLLLILISLVPLCWVHLLSAVQQRTQDLKWVKIHHIKKKRRKIKSPDKLVLTQFKWPQKAYGFYKPSSQPS